MDGGGGGGLGGIQLTGQLMFDTYWFFLEKKNLYSDIYYQG